ncbi:MAG TPA: fibronectin type III domain-containing protein [Nocardioidaceae bacterium]|nr:fibronectin type III domain-containing protein [Nocardioidaceae bacterium]
MDLSRLAPRAAAVVSFAALSLGSLVLPTAPALAGPVRTGAPMAGPRAAAPAPARISWFHDPLTAAQRRAQVAVPKYPRRYHGPLRWTRAYYRTHAGRLAVPAAWAVSHELTKPQALTFDRAGLFKVMSTTPSGATRKQLRKLVPSLGRVRAIRCEGYADHAGGPGREKPISLARARAICTLIKKQHPSIRTRAVGYGGTHPAVIGGRHSQRAANRRVVVAVTASTPRPSTPSTPRLLAVKAGKNQVVVTFRASAVHPELVTGYDLSLDGGQSWTEVEHLVGSGPYTVTLPNLTAGQEVQVLVRARWAGGSTGGSSTPVKATPYGLPGAPAQLKAGAHNGSITTVFTAPDDDGGTRITGYQISYDDGDHWADVEPTATGDGGFVVHEGGFTNGTTYLVRVRAVNKAGHGPATAADEATPLTVPDAPVLTSAEPGDGVAEITFEAPAHDGGTPVIGYAVSTDGQSWSAIETSGDSPYSVTLPGLTNGEEVSVAVRAENLQGWSPVSNTLSLTPLSGAPSAPEALTPVEGAYSVEFPFRASEANADRITGYEYSIDGETWVTVPDSDVSGDGPYTVTLGDLRAEILVDFQVRALWSGGVSAASNTTSATPYGVPGAPAIVKAKGRDGAITVSFVAPEGDGGRPVTGYQINYGDNDEWTDVTSEAQDGWWRVTRTGFHNGITYSVRVRAGNVAGVGRGSVPTQVTPITAPAAPILRSVTPGDQKLIIRFDPPQDDPGAPVTSYQATTSDGDGWFDIAPSGSSSSSALATVLTGLENGTAYQVAVRAINDAGQSAASDTMTRKPFTVPGAPTLTDASAEGRKVTLTFTAPDDDGGSPVTAYQYQQDDAEWQDLEASGDGPFTATIDNLADGGYSFKVRAVNAAGAGAASDYRPVTVEVLATVPDAPGLIAAQRTDSSADFYISVPADNGAPITGYEWTDNDSATWRPVTTFYDGIPEGTRLWLHTYNADWPPHDWTRQPVRVRAVNSEGPGPASEEVLADVPA